MNRQPEITFKLLSCFSISYMNMFLHRRKKQQQSWEMGWSSIFAPISSIGRLSSLGVWRTLRRDGNGDDVRGSGRTVACAQISSMDSAGTRPLFFPLLNFRKISPSSNFPTQIWEEQKQWGSPSTDLCHEAIRHENYCTHLSMSTKNGICAVNLLKEINRMGSVAFQPFD